MTTRLEEMAYTKLGAAAVGSSSSAEKCLFRGNEMLACAYMRGLAAHLEQMRVGEVPRRMEQLSVALAAPSPRALVCEAFLQAGLHRWVVQTIMAVPTATGQCTADKCILTSAAAALASFCARCTDQQFLHAEPRRLQRALCGTLAGETDPCDLTARAVVGTAVAMFYRALCAGCVDTAWLDEAGLLDKAATSVDLPVVEAAAEIGARLRELSKSPLAASYYTC